MWAKVHHPVINLLALALLLSLPALACSVSLSPGEDKNARETRIAEDIIATLTADAQTRVAEVTPTSPPSPTVAQPVLPTAVPFTPTLTRTAPPPRTATPAGTWIGEITFARDVTEDNKPVESAAVFKKGIKRVYAIFPYSGIKKGTKYTLYWTINGKEFVSAIHTWNWSSSGTHSTSTFYTSNSDLDVGNWKLAIFIGNELMTSGTFKIIP